MRNFEDIVILWGGADIHPKWYGQTPTYARGFSLELDRLDYREYTYAVRRRIPILGICRGHQFIAALRGGSLYQDFPTETGVTHSYDHIVLLTPPLSEVFGSKTLWVNSLHHQAVSDTPDGGVVASVCPDGIIEAIWYPATEEYPPMLGVQWHPELIGGQLELLRDFLLDQV